MERRGGRRRKKKKSNFTNKSVDDERVIQSRSVSFCQSAIGSVTFRVVGHKGASFLKADTSVEPTHFNRRRVKSALPPAIILPQNFKLDDDIQYDPITRRTMRGLCMQRHCLAVFLQPHGSSCCVLSGFFLLLSDAY